MPENLMPAWKMFVEKYYSTGVSGTVGHVRALAYKRLKDLMDKTGFVDVKIRTTGYLPLSGLASDVACKIDRRHGHFIVASGRKPSNSPHD